MRTEDAHISVDIDVDKLTWDELEEIEEIAGRAIGSELQSGNPSVRTIKAMIVWQARKKDPTFTMAKLGKVTLANTTERQRASVPPTGAAG